MTITGAGAYEAMRTHHRMLSEQLAAHVTAVSEAVAVGRPHEAAVAALLAYLAEEVLTHAAAEEETIYPAAAAHAGLAGTVSAMTAEHKALSAAAERLADLAVGAAAAEQARQIAELFAEHAVRENDVLLPALLADGDVDLAALLAQVYRRTEEAGQAAPALEDPAADPQAAVLSLLLEAATPLARADRARRPVAAHHGPGLPVWRAIPTLIDMRDLPPAQRHESIFTAYQALAPGAGFVLVNDHYPKPLRYQFEAEHAGQFTWQPLEAGPEAWRVRIGRPPAAGSAQTRARPESESGPGSDHSGAEPDLDVRQIAHWQRHDVIFAAYRALRSGAGFVLINDHDPLPLRY